MKVLEHEILKILFQRTLGDISAIGTKELGMEPLFKRDYESAKIQFGTLVDMLNNPDKYNPEIEPNNSMDYIRTKVTKREEVTITKYGWYDVVNSVEILVSNGDVADGYSEVLDENATRIIKLTRPGARSYITKKYVKEYKKERLAIKQIKSAIITNRSVRKTNNIQIGILILTAVLSAFSLVFSYLNYKKEAVSNVAAPRVRVQLPLRVLDSDTLMKNTFPPPGVFGTRPRYSLTNDIKHGSSSGTRLCRENPAEH